MFKYDQINRKLTVNDTAPTEVWMVTEATHRYWINMACQKLLHTSIGNEDIKFHDRSIVITIQEKAEETDIAAFAGAVSMSLAYVGSVMNAHQST